MCVLLSHARACHFLQPLYIYGLEKEVRCILLVAEYTSLCTEILYDIFIYLTKWMVPYTHLQLIKIVEKVVDARRDDDGVLEVRLGAMTK